MRTQVNGAQTRAVGLPRVAHILPKPGEMPIVIASISAARALGHAPAHDLEPGFYTVWPEFSEATK